jgi:hypothetical protein
MPSLKLYQDSRAPGTCRSCGAAIEWAELTTGKRMPFDRITPTNAQLAMVGGRIVEEVETTTSPTHFQSCPDAKDWRRR